MGLKKYGKGDWRNISRNFVTTRTPTQVASHAQKYYIRQLTGGKDKRRSSIHDITTVNVSDTKSGSVGSSQSTTRSSTSQDHDSAVVVQSQQHPKMSNKQQFDWKVSNEEPQMVFNSMNGNAIIGPFFGISSPVPKLEEQDFFSGSTFHGSQFDHHNARFEMQYQ